MFGVLVMLVMLVMSAGCANNSQWSVSESRTCAPKAAPRVCVAGGPDHGHVVELAHVELLPGECAVAVADARGGWVRVHTRDPQRERRSSWLRVPRGQTTIMRVDADGKPRHINRATCDQTPVSVDAAGHLE
jgi:hypothetical protein